MRTDTPPCNNHLSSLAWSPDGTKIAVTGWEQKTSLWDPVTGRSAGTVSGHGNRNQSIDP